MPEAAEQMGASSTMQSRQLWIGIAFAIVGPIACLNSLEMLKFTSSFSIIFISFLALIIILFAFPAEGLDPCADVDITDVCVGDRLVWNTNSIEVLEVLSIFVFAFTCHQVGLYIHIHIYTCIYNYISSIYSSILSCIY